jgi:hypothetical protein
MMSMLLTAALLASHANPLLGKWVAEKGPTTDGMNLARLPTMLVTRDMIVFGQQGRVVGTERIDRFETGDSSVAATTRFGETYRFRFGSFDRMCRVPEDIGAVLRRPDQAQCWRRATRREIVAKASL